MKQKIKETNSASLFIQGMGSHSLFPQLPDAQPEATPWQAVLNAFDAAYGDLNWAIDEFKRTQGGSAH
jgi:hypothetical protein